MIMVQINILHASIDQIVTVVNVSDYSIPPLTNMDGNMQFLVASSFLNKNVELSDVDSAWQKY